MGSVLKENGGGVLLLKKMGSDSGENERLFMQRMEPFLQRVVGYFCREWGAVPAENEVCSCRGWEECQPASDSILSKMVRGGRRLQSLIYVRERPFQLLIRNRPHRVRGGSERPDRNFSVTCVFGRGSEITSLTHPQKE